MSAYAFKKLPPGSVDAALTKAAHYRDLNQPEEAESICRDVLEVEPTSQTAWRVMGLALTDRLESRQVGVFEEALAAFGHLAEEYDRTYHEGIAWERAAKAHLERNEAHSAVTSFEHALGLFARAEKLHPESPDPLLRWNRCVRLLTSHPSLLAALRAPREEEVHLGD
jgi:tetratricopeptide (TPR) repeat protein